MGEAVDRGLGHDAHDRADAADLGQDRRIRRWSSEQGWAPERSCGVADPARSRGKSRAHEPAAPVRERQVPAAPCASAKFVLAARRSLWCMGDKTPRSGNEKKQGKSLKEKRSAKHAKKAERQNRGKIA